MNFFLRQTAFDFEPLEDVAKLSWELAPKLCSEKCRPYHQTYSVNRLIGLGGLGPWGLPFFEQGLSPLAQIEKPRVLISGGADTGVLALVIAALGTRAISSDFTYIDICKTPVEQNTLMATKLGLNAVILHGDVLDLDIEQVDAVVAHNFVSFFPPELRQRLFRKWFEALKPGGVALIANNASRYSGAKRPNRKGRDISKALSSLHAGALSWGMTSNEAAELIELTTLREYDQTRFPHLAIDEFKSEFIAAGFEVELVASDEDGKSLVPNAFLREESDLERESKRSVKSVFQLRRPFSVN